MMRRYLTVAFFAAACLLLSLDRSFAATTALTFTMPTGVDPPESKYLDHVPVATDRFELLTGLNLFGRAYELLQDTSAGICGVRFQDITCLKIQFTSASNLKVTSKVPKGSPYVPWTSQVTKSGNVYTVLLCTTAGSAPLSSWNVDGLGNGFFAALTASQGSGAADISNVTITPLVYALNLYQTPSQHVSDILAPSITASVDHAKIWSPNGKPVDVNLAGTVTDDLTQTIDHYISGVDPCSIQATLSYTDGGAPVTVGPVPVTITVNADGSVSFAISKGLDASRNGTSLEGRVYTFHITASDFAGNLTSTDITVTVTHDQGG